VIFDDGTKWKGELGEDNSSSETLRDTTGAERGARAWSWQTGSRFIEFHDGERWDMDAPTPGTSIDPGYEQRSYVQELLRGPLPFRITAGPRTGHRGRIVLGALVFHP